MPGGRHCAPWTPTAPWRLIGAILAGVPVAAAGWPRVPTPRSARLFDARIDGETREHHHQR
jgi:hypothetical protein